MHTAATPTPQSTQESVTPNEGAYVEEETHVPLESIEKQVQNDEEREMTNPTSKDPRGNVN
jgi:hypothetical protein